MPLLTMTTYPPIALFCFNRPEHTRKTLNALARNNGAENSALHVFADGPRCSADERLVELTRNEVAKVRGFDSITIHERASNLGLARNIIDGVSELVDACGRVVVLEDDLETSPWFLNYMKGALDFYQEQKRVFSISGFNYPSSMMRMPRDYDSEVYFNYRNTSWGWATWKDRWHLADWDIDYFEAFRNDRLLKRRFGRLGPDVFNMLKRQESGEINSWAIRWSFTHAKHDAVSLFPINSYVRNIGMDASGTHCGSDSAFATDLSSALQSIQFIPVSDPEPRIMRSYRANFFRGQRIWRPLKKMMHRIKTS